MLAGDCEFLRRQAMRRSLQGCPGCWDVAEDPMSCVPSGEVIIRNFGKVCEDPRETIGIAYEIHAADFTKSS